MDDIVLADCLLFSTVGVHGFDGYCFFLTARHVVAERQDSARFQAKGFGCGFFGPSSARVWGLITRVGVFCFLAGFVGDPVTEVFVFVRSDENSFLDMSRPGRFPSNLSGALFTRP